MPSIAYLCLEVGIDPRINNYCGGLGILAGDTIRSAADLGLDFKSVTLLYKNGWFRQTLDASGIQLEGADTWDYQNLLELLPEKFQLSIGNKQIWVQVWRYDVKGQDGHINPLYFLDTDVGENDDFVRSLSSYLYTSDELITLWQQMLIGIGGVQVLSQLHYPIFDNYHFNESHAVFAALELYKKLGNWNDVKQHLVFTTHTPLGGAHKRYSQAFLRDNLGEYFEYLPQQLWENEVELDNQQTVMNMTRFSLFTSKFSNGVSSRHSQVTAEMYPEFPVGSVTNGIHSTSWVSSYMAEVFDTNILGWRQNPSSLALANIVPSDKIQTAHQYAKNDLINFVNANSITQFDPCIFTIGFARRAVPYKRPNLIFTDYPRLLEIAKKLGGLQIVFSGKTHPNDPSGEKMIAEIVSHTKLDNPYLKVVFLINYNMTIGKLMTGGSDLWLNNPILPLEASGTSGMKAALNGIPSLSTEDGWWLEGASEGVTGWSFGKGCQGEICNLSDADGMYFQLENAVTPAYQNKAKWADIQKSAIAKNGSYFNTHRMLNEYYIKAYLK